MEFLLALVAVATFALLSHAAMNIGLDGTSRVDTTESDTGI